MNIFIGSDDGNKIEKVLILQDMNIIHMLNASQANDMLQKQLETPGYSVWSVVSSGEMKFIVGLEAKKCETAE